MKTSEMTPETFTEKLCAKRFVWIQLGQILSGSMADGTKVLDHASGTWEVLHAVVYEGKPERKSLTIIPRTAPMSLADVSKATAILNNERQSDIQEYVRRSFGKRDGVVEFSTDLCGSR